MPQDYSCDDIDTSANSRVKSFILYVKQEKNQRFIGFLNEQDVTYERNKINTVVRHSHQQKAQQ